VISLFGPKRPRLNLCFGPREQCEGVLTGAPVRACDSLNPGSPHPCLCSAQESGRPEQI